MTQKKKAPAIAAHSAHWGVTGRGDGFVNWVCTVCRYPAVTWGERPKPAWHEAVS